MSLYICNHSRDCNECSTCVHSNPHEIQEYEFGFVEKCTEEDFCAFLSYTIKVKCIEYKKEK